MLSDLDMQKKVFLGESKAYKVDKYIHRDEHGMTR